MAYFADYRIFHAVVQHGSMVSAARSLSLSPASISKSVSRLEDHYGTRLFHRTTRSINLTDEGEAFLHRVKRVLALMDEAEDFIREQRGEQSGLVRVSAPAVFAGQHIIPHLDLFSSSYPKLELDIHLSDAPVNPVSGGYDIAICVGAIEGPGLTVEEIVTTPRFICGSPAYLKQSGQPRSVQDLKNHNCISGRDETTWHLIGNGGKKKISVSGNIKTRSGEVLRESLLSGLGLGLLSSWSVGDALRSGKLKIVLPEYTAAQPDRITAVYPAHDYLPVKVKTFLDFFKDVYGAERYWTKGLKLSA